MIDGYGRFVDAYQAMTSKAEKVDVVKLHKVAKEPYATAALKDIDATVSAGYVQRGRVVNTISKVTVTGDTAVIKTCFDQTKTKFINPEKPSAPAVRIPPPSTATVSLVRGGGSWLLVGFKGGQGACLHG